MKTKFYTRLTMFFATIFMFTLFATAQTTLSIQISESGDDAEEIKSDIGGDVIGAVDTESSDLELCFDHEATFVGLIFRGVEIPAGANVTNAYVQFTVDAVEPGTTDAYILLEVYGAAEANVAAPFTVDPFDISWKTATEAVVEWEPGPSVAEGDAGENEQTPDISAVINEIIALDGWASGNNIMIVVTTDAGQLEDWNREMEAFDGDPALAAVLNITFEGGTGINSSDADFSRLVYPNPTEGKFNINNPASDEFDYEIYTSNGRLVSSKQNNTGSSTEVDMSNFVKGMYFVNVRTAGRSETHKLILK